MAVPLQHREISPVQDQPAGYKAANGKWEIVEFPEEYRQNTIHAALLRTGKVLLVAGSGNDQDNFDAKKYDTRIWDPVKGTIKKVPTPTDLFCTGPRSSPTATC